MISCVVVRPIDYSYIAPSGSTFTWNTTTTSWQHPTGVFVAYPSGASPYRALFQTAGTQTITPGVASIPVNLIHLSQTGTKTVSASGTNKITFQGNSPIVLTNSGATLVSNAPISSANKLTKIGAGQLTLGAANTFTSGISLDEGTLSMTIASALGAGGLTIGATGQSPTLNCNIAGVVAVPALAVTASGDFTYSCQATTDVRFAAGSTFAIAAGGATLTSTQGSFGSLAWTVSGGKLTKMGAGQIALGGTGTSWTGGFWLKQGLAQFWSTNCVGAGSTVEFGSSGGSAVTIENSNASASTLSNQTWKLYSSLTFGGGFRAITLSNCALIVQESSTINNGGAAGALAFTNGVTLTGDLTKSGAASLSLGGAFSGSGSIAITAGTLSLAPSGATISGGVTLSGGTLSNTRSPAAGITVNGALTITANTTLAGTAAGNTWTFSNGATLTGNATLTCTTSPVTISGNVGGLYTLTKAGAATLTVSPTDAWYPSVSVSAGALVTTNSTSFQSVTVGTGAAFGASSQADPTITLLCGTYSQTGTLGLYAPNTANQGQRLAVTGNATFAVGAKLNIVASSGTLQAGTWTVLTYTGTVTNAANLTLTSASVGGRTLSLSHDAANKRYTVTAV